MTELEKPLSLFQNRLSKELGSYLNFRKASEFCHPDKVSEEFK